MAEQTTVKLTKDKLDLEGVKVNFTVYIGDWRRSVSISPIDYKVFKKWHEVYAKTVIESIVKSIEQSLSNKGSE